MWHDDVDATVSRSRFLASRYRTAVSYLYSFFRPCPDGFSDVACPQPASRTLPTTPRGMSFSVRIVYVDVLPSASPAALPVIRIFGSTPDSTTCTAYIHGALPYFFALLPPSRTPDEYIRLRSTAIALLQSTLPHGALHGVRIERGTPFYGFHVGFDASGSGGVHVFLRVALNDPALVRRAAECLSRGGPAPGSTSGGGTTLPLPPLPAHEAHVPFLLQFFMDYNLSGMDWLRARAVDFRRARGVAGTATVATDVGDGGGGGWVENGGDGGGGGGAGATVTGIEVDISVDDILNVADRAAARAAGAAAEARATSAWARQARARSGRDGGGGGAAGAAQMIDDGDDDEDSDDDGVIVNDDSLMPSGDVAVSSASARVPSSSRTPRAPAFSSVFSLIGLWEEELRERGRPLSTPGTTQRAGGAPLLDTQHGASGPDASAQACRADALDRARELLASPLERASDVEAAAERALAAAVVADAQRAGSVGGGVWAGAAWVAQLPPVTSLFSRKKVVVAASTASSPDATAAIINFLAAADVDLSPFALPSVSPSLPPATSPFKFMSSLPNDGTLLRGDALFFPTPTPAPAPVTQHVTSSGVGTKRGRCESADGGVWFGAAEAVVEHEIAMHNDTDAETEISEGGLVGGRVARRQNVADSRDVLDILASQEALDLDDGGGGARIPARADSLSLSSPSSTSDDDEGGERQQRALYSRSRTPPPRTCQQHDECEPLPAHRGRCE